MKTVRDITAVRDTVAAWRGAGETVALVPTMGNLHRGHLHLVAVAAEHAERIVVSVYVNPTQFGPAEDLEAYPRTLDEDRARLRDTAADLLFVPDDAQMYPFGADTATAIRVPELAQILCGASRPGHFDGVTGVVCRLLNIVQPDVAVFGQKDFQQLLLIRRMAEDLHLPVQIVAAATQRDEDGLALSSRNQYLTDAQRSQAPALFRTLQECAAQLRGGRRDFDALEREGLDRLRAAGFKPDYFEIRRAADLGEPAPDDHSLVVLAAAYCGRARLIDNLPVEL